MPWLRRTRRAYRRQAHDDSRWSTWSVAVRRLLTIIPNILWLLTGSMFIHGGGGSDVFPCLPRAVKFLILHYWAAMLLVAQASMCIMSVRHELALVSGTTRYVSSANLKIRLPVVVVWWTVYDAGPRAEPCITLAFTSVGDEHCPAYLVQNMYNTTLPLFLDNYSKIYFLKETL